jgi:hypothetical protein
MFGQPEHEVKRLQMRKCKKPLEQHPLKQQWEHRIKTSLWEKGCEEVN